MSKSVSKLALGMCLAATVCVLILLSSNYARSDTDTIAYDNATSKSSTSTVTELTIAHTVGAGSNSYILVGVGSYVSPSAVTLDSSSMSLVGTTYETYNNAFVYLYYAANPGAGTHSVDITTNSATWIVATVVSYTGVYQGAPEVWLTTQSGAVNPFTQTITTVTDNSWVALMAVYPGGAYATPSAGSTLRGSELGMGMFLDKGPITPAGNASLGISASYTNYYGSVMVALRPGIVATPTPTPTPVPYTVRLSTHKTASQSVASTSLQPDSELWLGLEEGKTYVIDGMIFATSTNATPDIKFAWTATSSPDLTIGYVATDGQGTGQEGGSSGGVLTSLSGTGVVQIGTSGPMPIKLSGTVTMSQNGTLQFEWAQNASNSAAVTVMKGSYLQAQEIE